MAEGLTGPPPFVSWAGAASEIPRASAVATGLNHLKHWVEALQLDAGIDCCKAPVSLVVLVVAAVLPGVDLALEGGPVGDTPVEALTGQTASSDSAILSQLPCLGE